MVPGSGDVLIDQTMLCEASRLLQEPYIPKRHHDFRGHYKWWPPTNTERLVHLSVLLDALALHEHLYVLKAELPEDANTLTLRQSLQQLGILRELDTALYASQVGDELEIFFQLIDPFRQDLQRDKSLIAETLNTTISNFLNNRPPQPTLDELLNGIRHGHGNEFGIHGTLADMKRLAEAPGKKIFEAAHPEQTLFQGLSAIWEDTPAHWWLEKHEHELESDPLSTLGSHMLDEIGYFHSGALASGISHLRTFLYWRISEHARVVFLPSCRRLLQIQLFTDHLRKSMATQLYSTVARAFKSTIEMVYEDEAQAPLVMPPTLATFLDILQSSSSILDAVTAFRSHFDSARSQLLSLQRDFTSASSLQERLRIKQKVREVAKSIESRYPKETSFVESVVGFAPEVLKPLSNPHDPTKYSKELLTKPIEWIRDWWVRRPFRHIYSVLDRLREIENYESLIPNGLGYRITAEDKEKFMNFYAEYLRIYGLEN